MEQHLVGLNFSRVVHVDQQFTPDGYSLHAGNAIIAEYVSGQPMNFDWRFADNMVFIHDELAALGSREIRQALDRHWADYQSGKFDEDEMCS